MKKIARIYVSLLIHILRFCPLFSNALQQKRLYDSVLIMLIIALERMNATIKLTLMFFSYKLKRNLLHFFVLFTKKKQVQLNETPTKPLCVWIMSHVQFHLILYPFINFCDVIRVPFWHV